MERVEALINQGEGISVEFKESRKALNRDVYETVCAFLNRHGGTLLNGKIAVLRHSDHPWKDVRENMTATPRAGTNIFISYCANRYDELIWS